MLLVNEVLEYLKTLAPVDLALEGDNVGLLINSGAKVTGIMCALDITDAVVAEALEKGCNLIVAHHPVIYRPIKNVSSGDVVYKLVKNNISAICMHTNLDAAKGGVNDTLIELLGAQKETVKVFGTEGLGRIGNLPKPLSFEEFAKTCHNLFGNCKATKTSGQIETIAVLGGSGGDRAFEAFVSGADAYVTGEAGHHHAIAAAQSGKMLVVAGHFETEHPVVKVVEEKLKAEFTGILVQMSQNEENPYTSI